MKRGRMTTMPGKASEHDLYQKDTTHGEPEQ